MKEGTGVDKETEVGKIVNGREFGRGIKGGKMQRRREKKD